MLKHLALSAALALGACATNPAGSLSPIDIAKETVTAGHKAHQASGILLSAGAKSGLVHGSAASTAKTYFDKAETYLQSADAAIAAGDIAGAEVNAGQATTATGQATAAAKGN